MVCLRKNTWACKKDYEVLVESISAACYKGTVCDRCGVTTEKKFAERMGHIKLAVPVVQYLVFQILTK
jgi:DNA-directed RNA polymerase beta' subunit